MGMGESLIWVEYPSFGPATSQIKDNLKALPMVILIFHIFCGIKLGDPNYGYRLKLATLPHYRIIEQCQNGAEFPPSTPSSQSPSYAKS